MDYPKPIIGLTPDSLKHGATTLRKVKEVVVEGLSVRYTQMQLQFAALVRVLGTNIGENREIDLQQVVQALNSRQFRGELKGHFSTTEVLDHTELIKAALFLCTINKLTIRLLRRAVAVCRTDNAWRYRHYEVVREEHRWEDLQPSDRDLVYADGISLKGGHLNTVLRALSRFLPQELQKVWLSRYIAHDPDYITVVEFLYLLANSVDRKEAFESISLTPKVEKADGRVGLFPLFDVAMDRCSPDRIAQSIANTAIKTYKMSFVWDSESSGRRTTSRRKGLRIRDLRKSDGDFDPDLVSVLRTPNLRKEITKTLRRQVERVSMSKATHRPRATDLRTLKEDPKSPLLTRIRASDKYQMQYNREAKKLKDLLFTVPAGYRTSSAGCVSPHSKTDSPQLLSPKSPMRLDLTLSPRRISPDSPSRLH